MSQTHHTESRGGPGGRPLAISERLAALSRVGTALMGELDEARLLLLI